MPEQYTNLYQKARRTARLTQEQAAEALEISVESVKAYENDLRIPPNCTVAQMVQAYDAPWLALEHLQSQGRKIGVISHLSNMIERIPTQICVTKKRGGKSTVEVKQQF